MGRFNRGVYPLNDIKRRLAVNCILNVEEIAAATIGNPDFWRTDASYFGSGSVFYTSGCGEGVFNTDDPERGKALMKEINYK